MKSRFIDSVIFTREKAESLKKLRIIKQNLIRVQGIPRSLTNVRTLKKKSYFGQYGIIKDIMLSTKINEKNKENYSVYITFENEIQAACAILCADSLFIFRKIIRVFFGTTKYCSYFLNNQKCPNQEKCRFLHQLVSNEDIIIDDKNEFTFKEHLKLSKKIIEQSYPQIKKILIKPKKFKSRLPWIDFIFLSEEKKQKYCILNNYDYIESNYDKGIDSSIINNCKIISNTDNANNVELETNKSRNQNNELDQPDNLHTKNNDDEKNLKDFEQLDNVNVKKYQDPFELYDVFKDSINHILFSKPFFDNIRNSPLKKLEYKFLKNDLSKKGVDINVILEGCLDCIKDSM